MNRAAGLTFVVAAGNDATDNDPEGQFSEPIYRDSDASGTVNLGDVRLTPFGQPGRVLPAGPVRAGDRDLGRNLTPIHLLLGGRFRHVDIDRNNRFDAGEMIYFDTNRNNCVDPGDQRRGLFQFGQNQWGFGIVVAGDPDAGTRLAVFRPDERFWDRPMAGIPRFGPGGNLVGDGLPAGQAAEFPCAYGGPIICVAASNSLDRLVVFPSERGSSWGPRSVEVAAPGQDIVTLRRAAAGGGTTLVWGTSFAAPIVTGILAHGWTRPGYHDLTREQIRQLVLAGESPNGERFRHGVDPRFGLQGAVISGIRHDGRARMASGADFGDAPDPPYPTAGPGALGGNPRPNGARHEDFGEEWLGRDADLAESLDLPLPRPPTAIGADVSGEFEAFDLDPALWPPDPDGSANLTVDGDAHDDGVELLGPFAFSPPAGPANRARVRVWVRTANASVVDADVNGRYAGAAHQGSNDHSNDDGVHRSSDDKHVGVNGWFDWNRDGDWDDPGGHVLMLSVNPGAWPAAHPNAGVYELEFDMPPAPADAQAGELWARFRLDYGENAGQSPRLGLALARHAVGSQPGRLGALLE